MEVLYASQPSPGGINDDFVIATDTFVAILDGATAVPGLDTGCVHDVPWLVRSLGISLNSILALKPDVELAQALAESISSVCQMHSSSCDLTNPGSPSATVAILRERQDSVDYLVLCDSSIILKNQQGAIQDIVDDRVATLPSYTLEAVQHYRNNPEGFWVASTHPEAAYHAVTGSIAREQLSQAALLTDGASRLVERYGRSWGELLDILDQGGPTEVINRVRKEEAQTPLGKWRGKQMDDATAVLVRFL